MNSFFKSIAIAAVMAGSVLISGALGATQSPSNLVVAGEEHCVVNLPAEDSLNIRRRPSTTASIEARKSYGACGILVTGTCTGNWCPVEDGHSLGWAHRRYLSMVSPAMYCTVGKNGAVNLRAFPSTRSRVLVTLAKPTCAIAFLPYTTGNWQKVRVDGWQGWLRRTDVSGQ